MIPSPFVLFLRPSGLTRSELVVYATTMSNNLPSPEQVFRQVPCFCGALLIAARSVTRLYNAELRSEGIEATQYSILMLLSALGPVPLGALGERLAVDKTTISRNIRVLERHKWVALDRGQDARERVASLTAAGTAKLDKVRPHWDRAQKRMRASLASGEFGRLLERFPDVALAAMTA
jgi:DNA-binding MarR family transcriptional regulator